MYFVYILYSPSLDQFYKGQTQDLSERIKRHNGGYEKFTKKGIPWKLIWHTEKETKSQALRLEKKLKNLGRKSTIEFIRKYHEGFAGPDDSDFLVGISGC